MARRRAFKRTTSKQYGWACFVPPAPTGVVPGQVAQEVIVAGDSDVEVRAVGNTHANLKRIVGDLVWWPGFVSSAETLQTEPDLISYFGGLHWMLALVDNDDTNDYDPQEPTTLCEERVLAHGIIPHFWHLARYRQFIQIAGNTDGYYGSAEMRYHIDVRSNRRVRSDDDVRLYMSYQGTVNGAVDEGDAAGLYSCSLRALLKFP